MAKHEQSSPESMTRRYYTVDEANHALPLVRVIVADIVAKYAEVRERKERLDRIRRPSTRRSGEDLYSEEIAQVETDLEQDLETLQGFIDELTGLGIEVKDLSRGLVDFYSLMEGREVYLCWLLGEEEVGHWHELEAGFAGRQSLLAGSASKDSAADGVAGDS